MAKYCENCGGMLGEHQNECPNCGYVKPQAPEKKKEELAPVVSTWAYVGYSLLFSLGIVGLIVCIIFACNHSNKNIQNYAKSVLVVLGISMVLVILIVIAMLPLYIEMFEELLNGNTNGVY